MAHYEAYIARYGDRDFNEMPFNEVDGLIFSQLAYVDYAGIVGGADAQFQTLLDDAARQYFALHPAEEIDNEIGIVQKAIYLLQLCADTRRYGNTRLSAYVNNVNIKIDKQFSAVGFHLNDGSVVVAFRGTDTRITGVKESAMLSYMFPVPAQIEALYYFQETASLTEGDVRVCGHSKGGNLAVFAAVSCSNSLKKRIRGVYEYDAPGFPEPMVHRYDYLEMRDRLFSYVPERSVIVIDAGHGGEDGGAVAADGTVESGINLAIAQDLDALLRLLGCETKLTRTEDTAIYSEGAQTLREKKASDLKNRVALVNETPNAVLLSIHQNSLPASRRVHGAQAFHARTEGSEALAESVQVALNAVVNPGNEKSRKVIDKSVYLMKNISCPAVLVECGFLSNAEEAARLCETDYQRKLAVTVAAGFLAGLAGGQAAA